MLALFLLQMRQALGRSPSLAIWAGKGDKNFKTMEHLEFTPAEVKEVLLGLTEVDPLGGPEADNNATRPGTIAIFGPSVGDPPREVYVKVRLVPGVTAIEVECCSFHFPERPLRAR